MRLRRSLTPRWTALSIGSGKLRPGLVLIGVGFALLAVAALVAGSY
jgi:hypothetical protein